MADLTAAQLAELERLHREATEPPWDDEDGDIGQIRGGDCRKLIPSRTADAPLVVKMRNALPALLAAARREARLREALERHVAKDGHHRFVCGNGGENAEDCNPLCNEVAAALAYDGKEDSSNARA